MKKPETYTELIRWFNCHKLTTYYDISDENLEKIYFLLNKGWNLNGDKNVLNLVDPSGNMPPISISVFSGSSIERISIISDTFRVIYPASHYSSSSSGSSSNNNNNNNNNNNH